MAEPGWYDDPADPQALRWWDGSVWTEQVQPRFDSPQQTPAPQLPKFQQQTYDQNHSEPDPYSSFSPQNQQERDKGVSSPQRRRPSKKTISIIVVATILVGFMAVSTKQKQDSQPVLNSSFPALTDTPDPIITTEPVITPVPEPVTPTTKPTVTPTVTPTVSTPKPSVTTRASSKPSKSATPRPKGGTGGLLSPISANAKEFGKDTVIVGWAPPVNGPRPSSYQVTIRSGGKTRTVSSRDVSAVVTGVQQSAECSVEIRSVSGSYRSVPARISCRTV